MCGDFLAKADQAARWGEMSVRTKSTGVCCCCCGESWVAVPLAVVGEAGGTRSPTAMRALTAASMEGVGPPAPEQKSM